MKTNPEWCLMLLDERTHEDPLCHYAKYHKMDITDCCECAYSLEYKLKNLSQDIKEYLELK